MHQNIDIDSFEQKARSRAKWWALRNLVFSFDPGWMFAVFAVCEVLFFIFVAPMEPYGWLMTLINIAVFAVLGYCLFYWYCSDDTSYREYLDYKIERQKDVKKILMHNTWHEPRDPYAVEKAEEWIQIYTKLKKKQQSQHLKVA
jgi:hypothetical protein